MSSKTFYAHAATITINGEKLRDWASDPIESFGGSITMTMTKPMKNFDFLFNSKKRCFHARQSMSLKQFKRYLKSN